MVVFFHLSHWPTTSKNWLFPLCLLEFRDNKRRGFDRRSSRHSRDEDHWSHDKFQELEVEEKMEESKNGHGRSSRHSSRSSRDSSRHRQSEKSRKATWSFCYRSWCFLYKFWRFVSRKFENFIHSMFMYVCVLLPSDKIEHLCWYKNDFFDWFLGLVIHIKLTNAFIESGYKVINEE